MFVRNSNLHIRRFEFKYMVDERDLDKIRKSISNFMVLDPNAAYNSSNFYSVSSLYFDTDNLASYWEKVDGLKIRRKYRIRTYDEKLGINSKVYLEIKKKNEAIIFKDRSLVPLRKVRKAIEYRSYEELASVGEIAVNDYFLGKLISMSMKPKLLTYYKREAYLDSKNSAFRLTLDFDIRAERKKSLDFTSFESIPVLRGGALIEAKFNRALPLWFSHLVKTHNLVRTSFSKYCAGIVACGMVPGIHLPHVYKPWIF